MKLVWIFHADKVVFLGGSTLMPKRSFKCDLLVVLNGIIVVPAGHPTTILYWPAHLVVEVTQVRSSQLYALEAADELTADDLDGMAAARGEVPRVNAVELTIRHPDGSIERPRFSCLCDEFLRRLIVAIQLVTGQG